MRVPLSTQAWAPTHTLSPSRTGERVLASAGS